MNKTCTMSSDAGCQAGRADCRYELRFCSLFDEHRGFSFPCDNCGRVRLDELKPRERDNYLFVRALIGHDFALPSIVALSL